MRKILLGLLVWSACLGATRPASAATRALTLAEAVELAMRVEPNLAEAHIAEERSRLAVLRAQLDRVSLKIDGSVSELFNKANIGGPTVYNCAITVAGFSTTINTDPDTCQSMGGASSPAPGNVQSPQQGIGTFSLQANLNVPLFSGLRVESNVKRAHVLKEAATVGIRQARRDLALSVARAYWSVRRLALLIDVERTSLDRIREAEAVTDGRVKAGLAPPIDRNRAILRRLNVEAQLADLAGQLREATVQLGVTLGITDELVLTDSPSFPDSAPPDAAALIEDARTGRPEIAQARLQADAQHQAVKIAMSGFYPQLNAFGLFQLTNNAYNPVSGARSLSSVTNPFSDIAGNLTLGVTLSMNFFDTLNTWTSSRDARYEEARLIEEKRRAVRIVDADVRTAHARVIHLYGRRAPLAAARDVASDNLKILEGRYKNGDALVIEYLDGQNDLITAEQQLVDVTAQLQQAWLELEASLGKVVGANQ
jgi:outer membrane protein